MKRVLRERIRNGLAERRIGGLELFSSAVAHSSRERLGEVAKEWKRLRGPPFFSHEQQRRHGGEKGNSERRRERSFVRLLHQAVAQGAIADLVVILQEVDEGERRQRAGRLATAPALAMRRGLALIGEA